MIEVKINNEMADVLKSTRVSLELNSPLLAEDNLSPGSISYPFDLPCGDDSPKNSELLGTPDVVENTEGFRKVAAELGFDGVPFRRGKLIVREHAGKTRARVNFNFGVLAAFGEDFKKKKLADLLDEVVPIHSASITKKIYIKPGGGATSPYEITVNGKQFSNATLAGLASDIAGSSADTNATAAHVGTGTSPLGMTSPYVEIYPAMSATNPLTPLSVTYEGNGVVPATFRWLIHTFDIDAYNQIYKDFYTENFEDPRFSFPWVKNDNPYGEAVEYVFFRDYYVGFGSFAGGTKITNDMNRAAAGTLLVNDPNWGYANNRMFQVQNINSLQPFVRMRHVLDKIAEYFGFSYEGDFTTLADIDEMYLWNSAPLDMPMDFIGPRKFVFYRASFNIKELVPDITVRDFFLLLASRYNLGVRLNEKNNNLEIIRREVLARNPISHDITARCGRPASQEDLRVTGFRMVSEKETTDQLHAADQLEVSDPEEEVRIGCKAFNSVPPTNPQVLVNQKIGAKTGLVVFYMRYPSDGGSGIGVASPLSGEWVETLGGEDGIYETFWKYWLYFQQRRRVIPLPVTWNFRDIQELDWAAKYRFDRNLYMIKKVTVDIGPGNEIGVSDVQLYSMV